MKRSIRLILFSLLGLLFILILTFMYSRSWKRALFIDPLYELPSDQKVVALTFDDGPSKQRTPPLLDLLREKQVKATFFMLGQNIERHPEIAKQVLKEGHLIGNHSYDHPRMILKSPAFLKDQIHRTDQLIHSLGKEEVQYFRPPYCYKYIVLPLLLSSMGKILVTGTYDPPSEYKTPYPAKAVAEEVISNVRPGAIIFLHDGKGSDPEAFVTSVELIIDGLRAKGYRFVRLDDALETQ